MIGGAIRSKPLFFFALGLSIVILINSHFPEKLPPHDVSLQIDKSKAPLFVGGVIASEVETNDTSYGDHLVTFDLIAKEISGEETAMPLRVTGQIKVYLRNPDKALNYGDEILMKGDLRTPNGQRNPGGFDKKAYLERQGIRTLFYGDPHSTPRILNHHRGNFLRERAIAVKHFLSRSLSEAFSPRDAGFLKALFLGERRDMSEDFKDLFIKTGTMHILAVSGFNIGFLSLTLYFLLKPFRMARNLKLWLTLAMIWAYCLLVGWQSPVVRASVMATVLIAAQLLGRKQNVLNSLGLAALVILAVNPKQFFDVGFQLSFIAVFAMAQMLPIFFKRHDLWPNEKWTAKERAWHYVQELFWVSFVCLIATLPITVQNFYIVTPLSLLANMVVVPAAFLIFFLGVIFFLSFWWVPKWLSLVTLAIKLMMQFFIGALFVIENLPGAYFIVGKLNLVLFSLLVAGILFFLRDHKIKNMPVRAAVMVLFIFNIFLLQTAARYYYPKFRMTVLDVGEGDAIYLEFPKGGNLLIDAGKGGAGDRGRWVVLPFLKSKGVSAIDALVLSHPQEDHIGGMPVVMDELTVKNVFDGGSIEGTDSFKALIDRIHKQKTPYFHLHRGVQIEGFRDIQIHVLHPPDREVQDKNVNNESLVLKINYQESRFLLTGDIQGKAMQEILDAGEDVKTDVLKIPHHGSKLGIEGERFVRACDPKISVISVGEHNPFHHPSGKTVEILSSLAENRVYRTDLDRAVEIVSDGKNLMVKFSHAN